jgi:hypothetical protein
VQAQNRVLAPLLRGRLDTSAPPLPFRLVAGSRLLGRLAARAIGFGARPEHVRSPAQP